MQSEEVSMSLKVLRSHGCSITALAKEFGLNWRTVKRVERVLQWVQRTSEAVQVGQERRTVHRIWRLSNDPQFIERVRDIVGLYFSPPAHA